MNELESLLKREKQLLRELEIVQRRIREVSTVDYNTVFRTDMEDEATAHDVATQPTTNT